MLDNSQIWLSIKKDKQEFFYKFLQEMVISATIRIPQQVYYKKKRLLVVSSHYSNVPPRKIRRQCFSNSSSNPLSIQ